MAARIPKEIDVVVLYMLKFHLVALSAFHCIGSCKVAEEGVVEPYTMGPVGVSLKLQASRLFFPNQAHQNTDLFFYCLPPLSVLTGK